MATNDARDLSLHIDKAELRALYKTQPSKHVFNLILNWVLIITTIYLTELYFHPLLYVLAVIIIGARQHAIAILMHDAAHFRFLRNKKWNDLVTNFSSMYPLFSSIEQYRQNHLRHHMHLNTEDDPDWFAKLGRKEFQFPKTKREFIARVLSYFLLIKGIQDALWFLKRFYPMEEQKKSKKKKNKKFERLAFYIVLAILLTVFGGWKYFGMYWAIPYLSTFFMFQYIRSVAEHFGELSYDHLLTSTRSIKVNWIESFFFAPHNVGYHLEHHLYPGVPFYHLPKLHKMLMEQPEYEGRAHITFGYIRGLMNELGGKTVMTPTPA